jgi:hypothetical protein
MAIWKRFMAWCQKPGMIKIRTFNPHISMAGLLKGAKVGAVSGVFSGAVISPIMNFGSWPVVWLRRRLLNLPIYSTFESHIATVMQPRYLVTIIIMSIIFEVFLGLIFGLIFAGLYDKLPGKTPKKKGIVMSIIYWLAIPVGISVLREIRYGGLLGLYWFFMGSGIWVTALGLIPSILWGYMLGRFWTSKRLGKL